MQIINAVASTLLTSVATEVLDSSIRKIIDNRDYKINNDLAVETSISYPLNEDIDALDERESIGVFESSISNIELIREEILRQAKLAYNCALLAVFIGIVLISAGIIFIYFNRLQITIVSSIVGILSEFISAILFNFSNKANDKLEKVQKDLSKFENAKVGLELINNIEDQSTKDAALSKLIDVVLKNISAAV